jgi:hypothetical protein
MSPGSPPYAPPADSSRDERDDPTNVRADVIERAQRTLDIQRERFDRIDEKAARVLRFVALLLGAVLAVFSFAPSELLARSAVTSLYPEFVVALVGTVLGLTGAVVFAAVTYLTTRFRSSFGGRAAGLMAETQFQKESYRTYLLSAYGNAITENEPRIDRNARQFVTSLSFLVLGVASLSATALFLATGGTRRLRRSILVVAAVSYTVFLVTVVVRVRSQTQTG